MDCGGGNRIYSHLFGIVFFFEIKILTEKDARLKEMVPEFESKNWKGASIKFPNRTDAQCLHRWFVSFYLVD